MLARIVGTVGYVGYLRPASGTWGSAAALLMAYILHLFVAFPTAFVRSFLGPHTAVIEMLAPVLASIERDREWNDGAAKDKFLQLLEAAGLEDDWSSKQRRRLSAVLFT